ncbi:MAG: hypothetical protein CMC70_11520 [Flavobacteriaceae bacterium]|nr:hypothetical protein [Flavobacteriaceae bacterium]
MKPSSNVCGTTTKVPSKRAIKKQINIPWNSKLFFQVGLIVSLLATFFVMELEIEVPKNVARVPSDFPWEPISTTTFVVEKKEVATPKKQPKQEPKREKVSQVAPVNSETFVEINNDIDITEGNVIPGDTPTTPATVVSEGTDKNTPPVTTNIMGVEDVPVFPGCEGAMGNAAKIDCMSSKIKLFIGKRFETGNFDYFEPGSIQTIHTQFTIDTHGNIVEIKAKAPDKKLEQEAKRVIATLPLMKPGRQGGTPVNVTYSVPIHFQVNN